MQVIFFEVNTEMTKSRYWKAKTSSKLFLFHAYLGSIRPLIHMVWPVNLHFGHANLSVLNGLLQTRLDTFKVGAHLMPFAS